MAGKRSKLFCKLNTNLTFTPISLFGRGYHQIIVPTVKRAFIQSKYWEKNKCDKQTNGSWFVTCC